MLTLRSLASYEAVSSSAFSVAVPRVAQGKVFIETANRRAMEERASETCQLSTAQCTYTRTAFWKA